VGGRSKELERREQATVRAAEAAQREQQMRDEHLRGEEEEWLLEQLQWFIPEVGEELRERAQEIRGDVRARPSLRAGLVEISRFGVEWESLQRDCVELDVPAKRVWPAHIANHPEAALAVNSEFRVEPEHHLSGTDYGCLMPCKIQHKPVGDRFAEWDGARAE
jgi:hypothetical protein